MAAYGRQCLVGGRREAYGVWGVRCGASQVAGGVWWLKS
jgi:hypothetical protein